MQWLANNVREEKKIKIKIRSFFKNLWKCKKTIIILLVLNMWLRLNGMSIEWPFSRWSCRCRRSAGRRSRRNWRHDSINVVNIIVNRLVSVITVHVFAFLIFTSGLLLLPLENSHFLLDIHVSLSQLLQSFLQYVNSFVCVYRII